MAAQQGTRDPASLISLVVLAIDLFGILALGVAIAVIQRVFAPIYSDMGQQLPAATVIAISTPLAAHLAVLGVAFVALAVKEVAIRRPIVRFWINVAFLLLGMAIGAAYVAALFLPMIRVMEAMQKG